MRELAQLPVQGTQVVLREAVADDVPTIVALLAADQLGATRDGVANEADRRADAHRFYARRGFVASHQGLKLHL